MSLELKVLEKNELATVEQMINRGEDGEVHASMVFTTRQSRLNGKLVSTVTVGGVGTEPQYRRGGAVRAMLEKMFEMAPERGWAVSILHPFSFSYYRKFGYERMADHLIMEFPITKLDSFPRCADFAQVKTSQQRRDCVAVYEKWAENRNVVFPRAGECSPHYDMDADNKRRTYLWKDANGVPAAYIICEVDKYYWVNQLKNINLQVYEIAFTSPEALRAVFGFIRMYEGENDTVKIHNCAMSPEVDMMLRHYVHATYQIVPDLATRVLDVETVLLAQKYPVAAGEFTLQIQDTLAFTNGVWKVTFADGNAKVEKMPEGTPCDAVLPVAQFARLAYGYDEITPELFDYLEGAKLNKADSDLFRVFHKRPCGLFEHF